MHSKKRLILYVLIVFFSLVLGSCSKAGETTKKKPVLNVRSTAFGNARSMPEKYTCDGADVSPPLEWRNAPPGTKAFAIICDTPDAPTGTWVHWVLYDIPVEVTKLPESVVKKDHLDIGARQGKNDYDQIGYNGPCLPAGEHRYFFRLYALDGFTNVKAGATKDEVMNAMKGHILAEGALMGVYARE